MRKRLLFNEGWLFAPQHLSLDAPDDQFAAVTLPHTNKVFPHHNFDNLDYQFVSTYRKRFDFPLDNEDQLAFLEFDGVMLACTIYLNGELVREHLGGYISFLVDITDALQDGENTLTVTVDSRLWKRLAAKVENPAWAYAKGAVKVEGGIAALVKFLSLFQG